MSIEHFSVYRLSDGGFTGQQIGVPDTEEAKQRGHQRHALSAIPAGCAVKPGRFDHLSQRVDIMAEGHPVVDWQPPQPDPDHVWDVASRRWKLSAESQERQAARADALARIAAFEAAQHRPLREAALGVPGALERVREIEAQIAGLRGQMSQSRTSRTDSNSNAAQ